MYHRDRPDIASLVAHDRTDGMSFHVPIAGPRQFTNYPALRAALDALLVNRLPDVESLTCGGRGVPMLAASYASANGLAVTVDTTAVTAPDPRV